MKIPKTKRVHCPKCNKHTEHKVTQAKKKTPNSAHPMSYGSKKRAKKRGRMGTGSMGRYSKPALTKWRMTGRKQSKKIDLRFQCSSCKKMHKAGSPWRAKKVEFK